MSEETGIILPPGVQPGRERIAEGRGMIVNETDLPDEVVATYIEEQAGFFGVQNTGGFRRYQQTGGSLLARGRFSMPSNITEEIMLSRDLAERDDDVRSTMGSMLAVAFGEGMRNTHADEVVAGVYDECARHANLDHVFEELYREWLIASQVTTLTAFTRETFQFQPQGADRARSRSLLAPKIGVIPAEQILPIGNDIMGTAPLYYRPASAEQEDWLHEFFAETTSPGRKAEMRKEDPLLSAMLLAERSVDWRVNALYSMDNPDPPTGDYVYLLNPRMVARSTMPKGSWPHPRPLMTSNFALLEAKRLLNLMDYALLESGCNFLVIAKKGTDQKPAKQGEVENLAETLKRASKTGLIIGDHRLTVDIVTPDLHELLNKDKRRLLGRAMSRTLLRLPDFSDGGETEEVKADVELLARVITADRRSLTRHVERTAYEQIKVRNSTVPSAAKLWFPKIILAGAEFWTDMVLKMRDRGDISRRSSIEAGGFDYEHELAQRKREKPDDLVMSPPAVPFDSPNRPGQAGATPGAPNDTGGGRPRGARTGSNDGGANAPTRSREVVAVTWDDELGTVRIGECTDRMLAQYDEHYIGRPTKFDRAIIARLSEETARFTEGALIVVPVNHDYQVGKLQPVRLTSGLTALAGHCAEQNAVVTRAIIGRSPNMTELDVEELATRLFGEAEPLVD